MSVTVDAGRLQRLDQRIGQPLRQLVERHQAVGRVVARDRRMAPGIAERNAAELDAATARSARDGPAALRMARRGQRAALGLRGEMIEEPAGPRRVVAREDVRAGRDVAPRPAQQRGAALEPDQRVAVARPGSRRRASSASSAPAARHRRAADRRGSAENAPAANMAGWRARALRSGRRHAAGRRRDSATRPGARIEQDADDGEIEGGARPRGGDRAMRRARDARPSDRSRRARSAASAHGTARRGRDSLRG